MGLGIFNKPKGSTTLTTPDGHTTTMTQEGQANWDKLFSNNPFGGATPLGAFGSGRGIPGQNPFQPGAGPLTTSLNRATNQVAQQQAQATQQAQAAGQAAAAQKAAAEQQAMEESRRLLKELTARRLMMLRQNVQRQQGRNINLLRRNLAQRGALDSGSLGAGMTSLGNESSNILAQGTNLAANNEAEALLALLGREQDRQFQREQGQTDYDRQRQLLQFRSQLERDNRPSGIEQFLSGLGGAAGQVLPFWLRGSGGDT